MSKNDSQAREVGHKTLADLKAMFKPKKQQSDIRAETICRVLSGVVVASDFTRRADND